MIDRADYLRRKREGMARSRVKNPERARRLQREWHHRNKPKQNAKARAYYSRRFFWGRAMKLRGDDRASYLNLGHLWHRQRGCCALTGRKLDRTAQLDHIVPKAKGGSDAMANLRWVCPEVNYAKRDLADTELLRLCSDVVRTIGRAA